MRWGSQVGAPLRAVDPTQVGVSIELGEAIDERPAAGSASRAAFVRAVVGGRRALPARVMRVRRRR